MNSSKQAPAPQTRHESASDLLERILEQQPSERHKVIDAAVMNRVSKIEELLPDFMKGQGERLAKRAMLTFARNKDLQDCPPGDFVRCVLEAAEMGFSIDGKLCYVVRYKTRWQCQLDYKGLVAVAKRMKTIADAYADVVCENDSFTHAKTDGKCQLDHTYDLRQDRGDIIGAYAIVVLPSGLWRYELMTLKELTAIQNAAPSKAGPWSTHINEMRKKTVIRRCLKTYCDDPGLIHILDLTDELDEVADVPVGRIQRAAPVNLNGPKRQAAGEITDEQSDKMDAEDAAAKSLDTTGSWIESARAAFADAKELNQVNTLKETWGTQAPSNEAATEIDALAVEATERIKSGRGAGSNKSQKEMV